MRDVITPPSPGRGPRLKYTFEVSSDFGCAPFGLLFSWGKSHVSLAFTLFVAQLSLTSDAAVSAQPFDKSTLSYLEADSRRKNKIID